MAWYADTDLDLELPRRASGELSGLEAEVYKRRYSCEFSRVLAEGPGDDDEGTWYGGSTAEGAGNVKKGSQEKKPAPVPAAAGTSEPSTPTCRSTVTRGRSICLAVGDDICTDKVLKYAARYICKAQDTVSLVHMSKSSSKSAASKDGQLLERAKATLLQSTRGKVPPEQVNTAVLPTNKSVGQSLVAHCKQSGYHILVIGSRGPRTGMKAKLSSIVGESSVSSYCTENLKRMAVVVIKPPSGQDWSKS